VGDTYIRRSTWRSQEKTVTHHQGHVDGRGRVDGNTPTGHTYSAPVGFFKLKDKAELAENGGIYPLFRTAHEKYFLRSEIQVYIWTTRRRPLRRTEDRERAHHAPRASLVVSSKRARLYRTVTTGVPPSLSIGPFGSSISTEASQTRLDFANWPSCCGVEKL
jgi:hypothetical protein